MGEQRRAEVNINLTKNFFICLFPAHLPPTQAIAGRSEKLVNSVAIFLEQYNFDGVEIDRRNIDFDKV